MSIRKDDSEATQLGNDIVFDKFEGVTIELEPLVDKEVIEPSDSEPKPSKKSHFEAFDGLRGLASLQVFGQHIVELGMPMKKLGDPGYVTPWSNNSK